jgi:deoxyribodipyrimidine photo-lyase
MSETTDLSAPVLLWLRRELRLADNQAISAALATGRRVLPVFVLDDDTPGAWAAGGASRWWLHHSLTALTADLAAVGAPLVLRRGAFAQVIPALVAETGAAEIHAGLPTEPWARRCFSALRKALTVPLHLHRTTLLFEPKSIRTQTGTSYGVFSPYARACLARGLPALPDTAPTRIDAPPAPASDRLADWKLLPTRPDWAGGMRDTWTPGEAGARARLKRFLESGLDGYADKRNMPGIPSTSMLSPHLAWGEISPATIWHAAEAKGGRGLSTYVNELLWREFSAHLLWHHTDLAEIPLREAFAQMPWREDEAGLLAWQRGQTGIPIVDAGMRELWQTGWMHNRVRMIVASFLVKHLLIPWQRGEAWFWDTLVDADLATNAASWQWVAGSGADAAPYFRIFNPVLQGLKFDADGAYVRRYVPELAALPDRCLHAPWEAPELVLKAAGVRLGVTYPHPIIGLPEGRDRALEAFKSISKSAA